ncbi:MAG TPA: class I SAM-dependent methyltransferase [Jatrophihabitans sp.]|nr:class I SAM-dependent methyltransferase [Jatrophihabitans sp.]
MKAGLLEPYERALRAARPLGLIDMRGRVQSLDVPRWLGPLDAADHSVLDRCHGPVLDLGCGPGRFVRALAGRGVAVLGIDLAHTAVGLTARRGGAALQRDMFAPLPGEGRWPTVLLIDGNVGIGGDLGRLLTRVTRLLAPGGQLLVEVEPQDRDESLTVRFHHRGTPVGGSFRWARVGLPALRARSTALGLRVADSWQAGGRVFAQLQPR